MRHTTRENSRGFRLPNSLAQLKDQKRQQREKNGRWTKTRNCVHGLTLHPCQTTYLCLRGLPVSMAWRTNAQHNKRKRFTTGAELEPVTPLCRTSKEDVVVKTTWFTWRAPLPKTTPHPRAQLRRAGKSYTRVVVNPELNRPLAQSICAN